MKIKFLGTGGARFVVSKQIRASGGIYIEYGGEKIILDPGPGSLVRMNLSKPRIDPSSLTSIILTHLHIDHSNDVNIIADAITSGGFVKRGALFAPRDALYSEDRVVLRYTLDIMERVEILEEKKTYKLGNVAFETSIRHEHEVETYGIRFFTDKGKVGFLVDTSPFPGLAEDYKDCRLLVVNVVLYERKDWVIKHLSLEDVKEIASIVKPELLILTHFGMTMIQKKPWKREEEFSRSWGVPVKFAYDGMVVEWN